MNLKYAPVVNERAGRKIVKVRKNIIFGNEAHISSNSHFEKLSGQPRKANTFI
ncbi:MAG: hypothetical protein C5S49_01690 [Candidatus Methanogaster sp.]|nr:MAG: hypothetical protein C5S49_01690 [ANME-2 cluster archaeon]